MSSDEARTRHDAGFAHHYSLELLFDEAPAGVEEMLRRHQPDLHPVTTEEGLVIALEGEKFTLSAVEPALPASLQEALQQSWNFRDAREAVRRCNYSVVLNDEVADSVDPRDRVRRLRAAGAAIIDALSPLAVHSRPSRQLFAASDLLDAFRQNPGDDLYGLVNVRFYKVEGHDRGIVAHYDETVMDTVGLGALGLHDLQCQFKMLDPSRIGAFLYDTAYYLFENGPVIENGHAIRGLDPEQKWICRFEDALAEPHRVLLDINPGKPYAAGVRDETE